MVLRPRFLCCLRGPTVNTTRSTNIAEELRELLGPDRVLDANSDLAVYECDAFVIEKHCPNVAVVPETAAGGAANFRPCNEPGPARLAPGGGGWRGRRGGFPHGGGDDPPIPPRPVP